MRETIITAIPADVSNPTGPLTLTTSNKNIEVFRTLDDALETKHRERENTLFFAATNAILSLGSVSLSIKEAIELIENGGGDNLLGAIGFLALSLAQFYGAKGFHSQSKLFESQIDALAEYIPD